MQAVDAGGGERRGGDDPAEDLSAAPLDKYRVVVLSDVGELPLAQVERLEQFVPRRGRAGGVFGRTNAGEVL